MSNLDQLSEIYGSTYNADVKDALYTAAKHLFADMFDKQYIPEVALPQVAVVTTASDTAIKWIGENYGKIPAIKFFRSVTGSGLRESKDYVETLFDRNVWQFGNI